MQRLFHSRSKELYTRGKNLHTNLANSCKYPLVTQPHQDNRSRVLNQNHLSRDPNMSRDPIVMTYHAQELELCQNFVLSKRSPSYTKTNKITFNWNQIRSVCNEQTIRSTVAIKQAFMFNKMKNACCCCLKNH